MVKVLKLVYSKTNTERLKIIDCLSVALQHATAQKDTSGVIQ
jgi:hypothetical protein